MFKKNLLAVAVLALTSGVVLADNEAYISQSDDAATASVATVEQIFTDVASAHFAEVSQNATDTSTVSVYQGLTDTGGTAGSIDPTAPAITTILATAIDPTINAYVDPLAYAPLTAAVTNFALVKQDGAANANAVVVQVTGDEVADLDKAVDFNGVNVGIDAGTLTDGVNEIEPGAVSGTTDANSGNIAAIGQGAEIIDRAANTANSARQALARNLERLPAISPQWRATRRMYLATMHREMPAAVRRVVRGQ